MLIKLNRLNRESYRKIEFLMVGGVVMGFSFVQLWFLISVCGMNYWFSYVIQTIVSVELNFIGNYSIAWRDRRGQTNLLKAHVTFWATRGIMIFINPFIFAALTAVEIKYALAQLIVIVLTTVLNYYASDKLVFLKSKD